MTMLSENEFGASEADYDFIANARQDVLRLLDEIERLKEK